MKTAPCVLLLAPVTACAGSRAISGQVIDRNGQPVPQAIVSLEPGNVEVVTDAEGRFDIGYLRDDRGDRKALAARTAYRVEAFKVGFHVADRAVDYRSGQLALPPLTLTPETIEVAPAAVDLDPARDGEAVRAAGATYEGE